MIGWPRGLIEFGKRERSQRKSRWRDHRRRGYEGAAGIRMTAELGWPAARSTHAGGAPALGWRWRLAEEMQLGVALLLAVFVFLRLGPTPANRGWPVASSSSGGGARWRKVGCHTRFYKENRVHLTCAPGSFYTHMIDKTRVIPLQ
jgi:hypothetical protein